MKQNREKNLVPIIMVVTLMLLLLFYFQDEIFGPNQPEEQPVEAASVSELENNIKIGKDVIDYTLEKRNEIKSEKEKKENDFQQTRQQQWVYKLGDISISEEQLIPNYEKLKHLGDVRLFKMNKKSFFLYLDKGFTQAVFEDSLENMRRTLREFNISVNVVDLMENCNYRQSQIKQIEGYKFGKRKERQEIKCYTCDR